MSNNTPDYENDIVFPPQEIKSQHELSEQGRQSEVLIKAIEKCEKLEKEIIALKKEYKAECHRADELEDSLQTSWRNESKLKKQLEIAVDILEVISTHTCFYDDDIKTPIFLISICDLVYGILQYGFMFLLRGRIHFFFYLKRIILPEVIYTLLLTIFCYQILYKINKHLSLTDKRSVDNFV